MEALRTEYGMDAVAVSTGYVGAGRAGPDIGAGDDARVRGRYRTGAAVGARVAAVGIAAGTSALLLILCSLLRLPHLLGYLVHLGVERLLGGLIRKIFLLGLLYILVEVGDKGYGLFYLCLELCLLAFKLILGGAQLCKRGLVLGLDALGLLARGLVLLEQAFVRAHNLTYIVHCRQELAEAAALEEYIQVGIAAVLLHGAHTLAIEFVLLRLCLLGILELRALLLQKVVIEVNLLVYELYLLHGVLVLLVQHGLLLKHGFTLGHQLVNVGLHVLTLSLELLFLLFQVVYLFLEG